VKLYPHIDIRYNEFV